MSEISVRLVLSRQEKNKLVRGRVRGRYVLRSTDVETATGTPLGNSILSSSFLTPHLARVCCALRRYLSRLYDMYRVTSDDSRFVALLLDGLSATTRGDRRSSDLACFAECIRDHFFRTTRESRNRTRLCALRFLSLICPIL